MKIVFITPEYPHPKLSPCAGIGTSIKNLTEALVKKGVEVVIVVYHQKITEIIKENTISIHAIAKKKYPVSTWYFYRKQLQKYINSIVSKENIDIIEAADWTGISAFMRFQVPLVIRFHGSDAYFCKLEERKQKLKNFIFEKMALKMATAYIAPTTYAGKETQKIFKLNKSKIKTIHYGLQLKHFVNETPKLFNKNTILYIGTIIRKKGVFELAEIFNKVVAKHPEAKLTLIGGDAADIKSGHTSTYALVEGLLSKDAKKQATYLGKIPYTEVKEHIKNAHICVFPSFAETLGMVTIESMALQKPVVNTNIGWAQELIDNEVNGYLVHPSNIEAYANRILQLLKDEALCLKIGKAARQKVEETFNIEIIANQNIAYYNTVISNQKA